jgi:hypothetical protein
MAVFVGLLMRRVKGGFVLGSGKERTLERPSKMLPSVQAITARASLGRSVKASMASCTISSASTVSNDSPELHGS